MSSTNRGASRENLDFYRTQPRPIDALLDTLDLRPDMLVLEPAAGDGAIVRRLLERGHNPERIHAIELDPGRAAIVRQIVPNVHCADYMKWRAREQYDLILTNPPFALATTFARAALGMVKENGTVALLLRLNWLGSKERARFHREHPSDTLILPMRPEFIASMSCSAKRQGCMYRESLPIEAPRPKLCPLCGAKTMCSTTDSIEYAWFVWGPRRGNRWFILPERS